MLIASHAVLRWHLALADDKPTPNPHAVGWINTFLPGGGSLLLGEPWWALEEAAVEGTTFGFGYSISKRSPLTLDGVPEDYPIAQTGFGLTGQVCQKYDPVHHRCLSYSRVSNSNAPNLSLTPIDLTRPIGAAFLQEVGIKYHMINVFESYRESLKRRGGDLGQGLDDRSSGSFLLDPFRSENLTNPWVYIPLGILLGFVTWDYVSELHSGLTATQPLNTASNSFVAFNQMVLYPFGSGAPEEMFYRGFLQNEAYVATGSTVASVAASTVAFSLSHAPQGHLTAAISGAYLGSLASINHGRLGPGITLHFWSVLFLGAETFLLVKKSQAVAPPLGLNASFMF